MVVVLPGFLVKGVLVRSTSVISSKQYSERSDREYNQFKAMLFKLDGKFRHMSGSLREWITILS